MIDHISKSFLATIKFSFFQKLPRNTFQTKRLHCKVLMSALKQRSMKPTRCKKTVAQSAPLEIIKKCPQNDHFNTTALLPSYLAVPIIMNPEAAASVHRWRTQEVFVVPQLAPYIVSRNGETTPTALFELLSHRADGQLLPHFSGYNMLNASRTAAGYAIAQKIHC